MLQSANTQNSYQEPDIIGRAHSSQIAIVDDTGSADRVSSIPDVPEPPRYLNSVDATIGQPIVDRVVARKQELEAALAALPADDVRERSDLELALSTIGEMLTGNLSRVPAIVASDMSRWLERTKHLAETPAVAVSDHVTAPIEPPTSVEQYSAVSG
jgi:hypothetical protein